MTYGVVPQVRGLSKNGWLALIFSVNLIRAREVFLSYAHESGDSRPPAASVATLKIAPDVVAAAHCSMSYPQLGASLPKRGRPRATAHPLKGRSAHN